MPVERELRLAAEDIERFAAASGDRNPLHFDAEFAAGTAFGSPIVHGALIAIAMLGALPEQELARVRSLRISFSGALVQGKSARMSACPLEREPGAWEVRLTARGRTLVRVLTRAAEDPSEVSIGLGETSNLDASPMRTTPAEPSASELATGRALRGAYAAGPELAVLARRLGAQTLDQRLLEGLAWSSYVVGMELPGLRSLFVGLALAVDEANGARGAGTAQTLVVDHDERTGQLSIDGVLVARSGAGRVLAKIQCFELQRADSPDPASLGLELERAPAQDRGAVVVAGGSRGFGASLTLALLALGYEVHVAYATSQQRARELARLAGACEARLHLTRLDVRDADAVRSLADNVAGCGRPLVGLVLNAALPPLAMSLTAESATELSDYVAASLRLIAVPLGSMLPALDAQRGWVLFCSSTAIAQPPRDWPHYVSAKAAVEGLARWVAATKPSLRTVIVRPPKMQTAMSGTPSGRIGAASADVVAHWTATRLAGDELDPGLTMLEPETQEPAPA